jgi:Na+-transporting NADH:ubiquinone oxidoreductase subunit B/electron transport complex protein RnfD
MSLRSLFQALGKARLLAPIRGLIHTIEGIVLGTPETTREAPHIRDHIEIKRYMSIVIIGLLPSAVASIVFYGWRAVAMIAVSYLVGGVIEVAFALIRKKDIEEGFLVTGLIFPLILPPTAPLWMVAVGSAFGVFFGKEVFGGTGRNIFNPALVGRLFITIAFPAIMSATWRAPFTDAITSATPLSVYKSSGQLTPLLDLLLGTTTGSTGELFRVGIIAGGLFLMATRVANWRVPLSYLATVFVLALVGNLLAPGRIAPPLFQLLTGGLLFGAMFMATDPVTSPGTAAGKYVFGIGCGVVTVVLRTLSGFTEGVMFSIVLLNAFAPLIDTIVLNLRYKATTV